MSPTRFTFLLFAALLLGAHACKKSIGTEAPPPPTIEDILRAPNRNNYNTEKRITINVQLQSSSGAALRGVWVTFLHEGAGYTNRLLFYTYPTGLLQQQRNGLQRR